MQCAEQVIGRWCTANTSGLSRTSAVDGSILSGLEPAIVIVLAALFLAEAVTRPILLAVALALGGLVLLTASAAARSAWATST